MRSAMTRRKLAVHGPVVDLECAVPELEVAVESMLGCFAVPGWPDGFVPINGSIQPYDQAQVTRHLSATARHLMRVDDLLDIYEEGERYWLADDRWGMCELNLLRGSWRSWILPAPRLDAVAIIEQAALFPLAQLIRSRGVYLLPSVSVVRDGFASLILSPFSVEPELMTLATAGYRLIGQRWTAIREEDGRLALLHMPGRVERSITPRLRSSSLAGDETEIAIPQLQVASQNHAFCDAVLVAEPGRRPKAHVHEASQSEAIHLMRDAWPIIELHPTRRQSPLPGRLAQCCQIAQLQLSRNPKDLLSLLNSLRYSNSDDQQRVAAA